MYILGTIIGAMLPILFLIIIDVIIKKRKFRIKKCINVLIIFNLITLICLFGFFKSSVIGLTFSETLLKICNSWLKIIILNAIIGVVYIALSQLISKYFNVKKGEKLKVKGYIIAIISIILTFVGLFAFGITRYFISTFGNITPEQMIFNFVSPTTGMGEDQKVLIVFGPILNVFLPLILFCYLVISNFVITNQKDKVIFNKKRLLSVLLIFSIIFSTTGGIYCYKQLQIGEILRQTYSQSDFFDKYYISPNDVELTQQDGQKRNLIHIYLESMENTYLSTDLGGAKAENMLPGLTQLGYEGIVFSNSSNKFGGPNQTFGSSWSVAGMINIENGIPLKTAANSYGLDGSFLPGSVSLGDILGSQGYEQTVMFGADADYGGLTAYYTEHGNYNIMDYKYALESGKLPEGYAQNWGYEDDKLYEFAREEIIRLNETGKPFNFTMETADTHFPGYEGVNTPKKYNSIYANAISYSDSQVTEFIRWIQKQPFYENTTIVISGDHLSMERSFFQDVSPEYKRSVFNLILNPANDVDEQRLINRNYAPSDFFPTILASMGYEIEGNRLGIGTNLFSKEKTLIEMLGFNEYENEIGANSTYYNQKLIDVNSINKYNHENVKIK